MDDSLRLIRYLYDEDVDDPDFARRVVEDDELRRECERLRQAKDALDRRSTPSPDPEVTDRVVEQAAAAAPRQASAPVEQAPDRAPRTPDRAWSRRLRGVSAALMVLLIVGVGWWQFRPTSSPAPGTATSETAPQETESVAAGDQTDEIPEWDDRDELVRLHRRIEMLRTRSSSDTWGTDLQTVNQAQP